MEDAAAEPDEWDDEDNLEGIGEVIRNLRSCDVEPEDKGQHEAEDGG